MLIITLYVIMLNYCINNCYFESNFGQLTSMTFLHYNAN